MKMAPHPAIAHGKACYVGDPVAVVVAETLAQAKDAAEKVEGRLRGAARGDRSGQGAGRRRAADPRGRAAQTPSINGTSATQRPPTPRSSRRQHVTKLDIVNNRLVPNAIEPRAAIGEYDAGTDSFTLWNTTQNPHVARLVISAFVGMAPEHKLRVIAPDVGGGFGSKIFIYPEEVVCLWASRKIGRPVKWMSRSLGGVPHRRPRPRPCHPCRDGVRRRRQDHRPAREDHRQSRRLHVDVLVVGADLSLRHAAVRPVRHSGDLLRGRRGLHQHRAGRRLSRRRTAGGDLRGRAAGRGRRARDGHRSRPICARRTSSRRSRTRRR